MALTNRLKKLVDQPLWEWMRFSPFTSLASNILYNFPPMATGSRYSRYIYATNSATMLQYDTFSDSWNTLAGSLPTAPASTVAGNWDLSNGHYGNMVSAVSGSSTAEGAFINEAAVVGLKIKIINGLGRGQEKIITACTSQNIEYLTPTATYNNTAASIGSITDNTKKWIPNQWVGYQVKAYLGTSQQYFIRRILFNNNDTLFFANSEWHVTDPHQAYNHVYDASVIAVGTATRCVIEKNTITVDSPWVSNLDKTSKFEINVGSLVNVQNQVSSPFFLAYRYDPLYANWFPLHVMGGVLPNYLSSTTLMYEPLSSDLVPKLVTGSLTSGSFRSAQDTTQNWSYNQWRNYRFVNKANGISRMISSNDSNTIYFAANLDVAPSGTHQYEIVVDDDKSYIAGGNFAAMGQFSNLNNSFYPSQRLDEGVANVAYVRYSSSFSFQLPISAITRTGNIATVTTITGHPFTTGDKIIISGSTGADSQYYNEEFVVTSSYALSAALAGTNQPTQFTYGMSGTPSANAVLNTHTATLLFDSSKKWINNEWVGKVIQVWSSSPTAPTVNYSRITANTSQSLTLATAMASATTLTGNTGVWGYNILSDQAFGASWGLDTGITTATSSFYFTGSTVSGQPFLYLSASQLPTLLSVPVGAPITGSGITAASFYRSYETSSNGLFVTASLSQNAASTQNNVIISVELSSSRGFGTATGGTASTLVDTTKNWPTNFWVGAQIRFLAGTGVGQETSITSNTNNTITFSTTNTANATTSTPDTTTVYSILPIGRRNTTSNSTGVDGAGMIWVYGRESGSSITPQSELGKYIWCFEGNSTMRLAKYNIATMMYEYPFIFPFHHATSFNLGAGTYYAYDGKNRIYIQPNTTAQFLYIDTDREISENASTLPAGAGTARASNKMIIKTSEDGLDYLYYMRQNDTSFLRTLIFY